MQYTTPGVLIKRYQEIINESMNLNQIQQTVYAFVANHLDAERDVIGNVLEVARHDTFWTSEFDTLNASVKANDFDQILGDLEQVVSDVAYGMKRWIKGNGGGDVGFPELDDLDLESLAVTITKSPSL